MHAKLLHLNNHNYLCMSNCMNNAITIQLTSIQKMYFATEQYHKFKVTKNRNVPLIQPQIL